MSIILKDVSIKYNKNTILSDINLTFQENSINSIIGLSGSGKTTLLKTINKINPYSNGDIYINEQNLKTISDKEIKKRVGYVIQGKSLFPFLNVKQNFEFYYKTYQKKIDEVKIKELFKLALMDYDLFKNKYVDQLSGGQKQRIILLILISLDLEIVLLDEPFSALDPYSKKLCQDLITDLSKNTTIILVSHDPNEVIKISKTISIIDEGKLQITGSKEDILNSNLKIVQNFFADIKGNDYE